MFFGQYEHAIDDKSRITLPARFRDALADGVVLSKGLDGSVDVYPRERLGDDGRRPASASSTRSCPTRGCCSATSSAARPRTSRTSRAASTCRRRSSAHGKLGKDVTVIGSNDHLEIWDRSALGGAPGGDRRERGQCCRTSCRTARLITPPSSRTRCAALLAVQPGETVVDATFGAGGHARLLAQDLAGQRQARRDRPRPERQAALRPLQGAGRGRRPLPPRRLRDRPQPARRERHQGRRDPARHRRLVDADRPARARLLVRDRRAARHAHGSRPAR